MQQARPDLYPDYHFLLIAPNLGAEWLFDAARAYWDRYRPTIINDFSFVPFIPPEKTIIVTVVARRDTAPQLGVQLAQINANAYFDSVVYDLFDDAKKALEDRASQGQPFGVPLNSPTPTIDPASAHIPTPRLAPTNPPAGFVTEAPPTPTPQPSAAPPTSTPQTSGGQPTPLSPTPGSVVG